MGDVRKMDGSTRRFKTVRLGGLVGKYGLEREYDDTLRGSEGIHFVEVSARGQMVREADAAANLAPVPGTDLHTTIDLDLQRYISRTFPAGQRGAVMALNPNTGEVLALYSAPGFDPNAFVGGISTSYWRSLNESAARPLLDRAIQARYPPGSTWKLAVALNLAIGQGENAQTLAQMVRLYQQLASDGRVRTPFIVRRAVAPGSSASLDLNPDQLAILRRAMIAVVEEGTARSGRLTGLQIAGKTGTAQNPHGASHGWFIGFAPADVPTFVATIWQRQLIWLGLCLIVAVLIFRTSPRMLEWATPFAYAIALLLLLLTLFIGTGAGTAASSKSWISIGGRHFGQPAEVSKGATILMLARWLAALREPPSMLRDLIIPGIIAGGPCLLVLQQPPS